MLLDPEHTDIGIDTVASEAICKWGGGHKNAGAKPIQFELERLNSGR